MFALLKSFGFVHVADVFLFNLYFFKSDISVASDELCEALVFAQVHFSEYLHFQHEIFTHKSLLRLWLGRVGFEAVLCEVEFIYLHLLMSNHDFHSNWILSINHSKNLKSN